jgi:hypothetical protein
MFVRCVPRAAFVAAKGRGLCGLSLVAPWFRSGKMPWAHGFEPASGAP